MPSSSRQSCEKLDKLFGHHRPLEIDHDAAERQSAFERIHEGERRQTSKVLGREDGRASSATAALPQGRELGGIQLVTRGRNHDPIQLKKVTEGEKSSIVTETGFSEPGRDRSQSDDSPFLIPCGRGVLSPYRKAGTLSP